jgi:hypothetical protein
MQVRTKAEAVAAIAEAKALSDHFIFMEVIVDKRDAAPCAGMMRAAFLKNHFDMHSYHIVTHSGTQQVNSSPMTSGLPSSAPPPERQAETTSGARPRNLGSSSCLPVMTAAATVDGLQSTAGAPEDGAHPTQLMVEHSEQSDGKGNGVAKSVAGLSSRKRGADGSAKDSA